MTPSSALDFNEKSDIRLDDLVHIDEEFDLLVFNQKPSTILVNLELLTGIEILLVKTQALGGWG